MKTHTHKALTLLSLAVVGATNIVPSFAATQIGTGSVVNSGALTVPVMWNDTYTANSASGSVSGIIVTAKVLPSLNMSISKDLLDLGTLTPGVASSTGLTIEVGTNAANGVQITARSTNGALVNASNSSLKINSTTTPTGQSYKFASSAGTNDSSYAGYTKTATLNSEVVNNTTEHLVATTNKPEKTLNQDDINFTVSATATDETAAGNYRDTITFTVTGNF